MEGIKEELQSLLDRQRELDGHIAKKQNFDMSEVFDRKLLAFVTEIAEMLNEHKGIKYWKVDRTPTDRVLEEYVDGLHFILSIGNDINFDEFYYVQVPADVDWVDVTLTVIDSIGGIRQTIRAQQSPVMMYGRMLAHYLRLGELFGFSAEQVLEAYADKNAINYERQRVGY